jgi:hypothetical protein
VSDTALKPNKAKKPVFRGGDLIVARLIGLHVAFARTVVGTVKGNAGRLRAMMLRLRRSFEKTTNLGSAIGRHQKVEGNTGTIMPMVPAPPEPSGRRGVGREARMEAGLPDRAILVLLPPSASGFFLPFNNHVTREPDRSPQNRPFNIDEKKKGLDIQQRLDIWYLISIKGREKGRGGDGRSRPRSDASIASRSD